MLQFLPTQNVQQRQITDDIVGTQLKKPKVEKYNSAVYSYIKFSLNLYAKNVCFYFYIDYIGFEI